MIKKGLLLVLLTLGSITLKAQDVSKFLQLLDDSQSWILRTPKIEKKEIVFENYTKDKVSLNTMIWKFLPNGSLEYDYQSSEDVFACAGVDFLDMDVEQSRWQYNPADLTLTLQIKGGYASLDDFIFKRVYKVSLLDEDDAYGYKLNLLKEYFYNDLKKAR
ncbi:hypothetical protein [Jiulongibacter sp. NS-SX5]|uniref:hypothetical protein n=1 Tax=Jiulongibacter sp. NS-SX5 TaxID=3463854 RepID=UPI00405A1B84